MSDRDEISIDGDSVTLRAAGIGRYVEAAFLAVWLIFWVIGEAFALAMLGSMLTALSGFLRDHEVTRLGRALLDRSTGFEIGFVAVFLFLALWVSLWTVGGVAAGYAFLRALGGRDRVGVTGGALEVSRRAGPFVRTRRLERALIRRIRVRAHDKAVVADLPSGTITLCNLGKPGQRASVCEWLRQRLGLATAPHPAFDPLAAPPGWQSAAGDAGAIHLFRPRRGRHIGVALFGAIAAITASGWYADITRHGLHAWWPGVAVGLLALLAAWIAVARDEWIARPGQLAHRRSAGPFGRERLFEQAALRLTSHTDSDGDTRYTLQIDDGGKRRLIASAMFDDTEVVDCARWLAGATGFRIVK